MAPCFILKELPSSMEPVIETRNLIKQFGRLKAVNSVSLSVNKGEIYGFLGLNGAGKTTTIRMLLGLIRPTSGESFLNGERVQAGNRTLWNSVGYLVEIPYAYPELTVRENLEIIRRLRFISDPAAVDSVIEKLQLGPYRDERAKNLSLGNAQRLGLAKAIIHNPAILLLDEPANGLDPAGIVEIRELFFSLAHSHGVTIFISSHILGEISKFATRIGIIHEGKLIQESDIEQLEKFRKRRLLIEVRDKEKARSVLIEYGLSASFTEGSLLELNGSEAIAHPEKVNSVLVQAGFPPGMLRVEEEDLETYFLRMVGRNGGHN
jgi:ABC-2 type transport system ATP-binding protein